MEIRRRRFISQNVAYFFRRFSEEAAIVRIFELKKIYFFLHANTVILNEIM